ncbi:S26 family signal peptidase [Saccharopolyspora sp. CA-218241]|uniref:S26 family signal peptidase n=1 Tax=Saccharopolyspora sp. CA-218241 TaxID=3240027 RepID=UPI003D961D6C
MSEGARNEATTGVRRRGLRSVLGRWPVRRVLVRGASMVPTLRDRDVVLLRVGGRPAAGSVVLVRWSARPGQLSVKRAVRPEGPGWHVEGDNGYGSTDSRELGPAEVLGSVRWRLWPNPGRVR